MGWIIQRATLMSTYYFRIACIGFKGQIGSLDQFFKQ